MKRQFFNGSALCLLLLVQTAFAQITQVKNAPLTTMKGAYILTKQVLDSGLGPTCI
jgi:hypothetical protein